MIMKNILLIAKRSIFFLFTLLMLFACQEIDIDSQGDHSPLIKTDVLELYNVAAEEPKPIVFNLNSNIPWEVIADQQWCHITPSLSGSSSLIEDITIAFDENKTFKERKATIRIKGEGNKVPVQEFVVIQEAKTDLKIQPIDGIVATEGGKYIFTITSNKPWKLFSEKQWLTFDKNEGEPGNAIEIKASALTNAGAKRTSKVTVTLEDGAEKSFVVTQNGMTLEFAEVDPENLIFSGIGETKEYEVLSTAGAWTVTSNDPAVNIEKLEDKVRVTLKANHLFIDRNVQISLDPVVPIADFIADTLVLEQPTICLGNDPNKIILNQETGSALLNESTNAVVLTTSSLYKYGIFTWKFAAPHEIQSTSFFEIKSLSQNGSNLTFSIKLATNQTGKIEGLIRSGGSTPGGSSFWADIAKFPFTVDDLKQMETLKMKIEPFGNKLKISIWVNDILKLEDTLRPDPWKSDTETAAFSYQFGFFSVNNASSMTINSFSFEPIE